MEFNKNKSFSNREIIKAEYTNYINSLNMNGKINDQVCDKLIMFGLDLLDVMYCEGMLDAL